METIHRYQKICFETYGLHFIHASDEWYLLAGQELPEEERYDGYLQLENGVGMLRLLREEFAQALAEARDLYASVLQEQEESCSPTKAGKAAGDLAAPVLQEQEESCSPAKAGKVTVATGVLAAPMLQELAEEFQKVFPQKEIQVIPIVNHFFGEQITVSGLLTGQDIIAQLKDRDLGGRLLLPCNLLRSGEEVFLDDITLSQMENALQVEIDIVKSSGQDLVSCLIR